jgi:hypothetical protein
MRIRLWLGMALCVLVGGGPAMADVWDFADIEDDSSETDNELVHGMVQVHDLLAQGAVFDEDWYRVDIQKFSSYEVVAEGLVGELYSGPLPLDRIDSDGTTVLSSGVALPNGLGASRSLRWTNNSGIVSPNYIRVTGANSACGTTCTTNDQYTIRFYDTTGAIARFNNAGTQLTVLLLQNTSAYTITGAAQFWTGAGAILASFPFTLNSKQLLSVNTASIVGPTAGHITVINDGRFGDLQGKAVALEPSTGFSFDSPLVYKPH